MDVMEFVTEVKGPEPGALQKLMGLKESPRSFEVKPSFMYPAMVAHIKEATKKKAAEEGVERYYAMAKRLQGKADYAFNLALLPKRDCNSEVEIQRRAEALEICRLWFTRMLHMAIGGGPMNVRILRDDRYRL
jgi:hypothetical protein